MNWITGIGQVLLNLWKAWQESKEEKKKTAEQKAAEAQKQAEEVVDKAKEKNKKEMDDIINSLK